MSAGTNPTAFEKDLYATLQVSPRAEVDVIHAAYRALLKKHAPRAIGDDEIRARDVNEAYAILENTTSRYDYDNYRNSKKKGIGPYRIIRKVATGGFGTTYEAVHTVLGEKSCIKHASEISPEAERVLKEETKAIWDLRHYGIPSMRDLIRLDDGSFALAMSWIEGATLEQIVEKKGPIDPENVAWLTERQLNTLVYLHHHGIIHGDIKPQNSMVQDNSHIAVLVDYGLSMSKPTATSSNKGYTDIFSPPEQIVGRTLVPSSDFYSLGVQMAYSLGGGIDAAIRLIRDNQVVSSVPEPMCRFIKRLIKRNPLERPMRTQELFEEFTKVRLESFGRTSSNMKAFSL